MKVNVGHFYELYTKGSAGTPKEVVRILGNIDPETFEGMLGYLYYDDKGRFYNHSNGTTECSAGYLGYLDTKSLNQALVILKNLKETFISLNEVDENSLVYGNGPAKYMLASEENFSVKVGHRYVNRMGFVIRIDHAAKKGLLDLNKLYGQKGTSLYYDERGKTVSPLLPDSVPSLYDIYAEIIPALIESLNASLDGQEDQSDLQLKPHDRRVFHIHFPSDATSEMVDRVMETFMERHVEKSSVESSLANFDNTEELDEPIPEHSKPTFSLSRQIVHMFKRFFR